MDLSKISIKDYWTNVNNLFTMVRKKKIDLLDKKTLAKYPQIRNKKGETLLVHFFMKGYDVKTAYTLMDNNHVLLVEDIYYILNNMTRYTYEKVIYLIDLLAKKNQIDKKKLSEVLILCYFIGNRIYGGANINIGTNINNQVKTIKYCFEKGYLHNDLTDYPLYQNFNIAFHTIDMDIIKWFDQNFKMKWNNFNKNGYNSCQIIGYYMVDPIDRLCSYNTIIKGDLEEYMRYFMSKNPNYLTDKHLHRQIHKNGNLLQNYHILKTMYKILGKPDKETNKEWELLKNKDYKWIYINGMLLGDYELTLGMIKKHSLKVEDIKQYLSGKSIGGRTYDGNYYNERYQSGYKQVIEKLDHDPITIFIEDLKEENPDLSDSQLEVKYPYLKFTYHNNYLISKADCIAEMKRLKEYLAEIF